MFYNRMVRERGALRNPTPDPPAPKRTETDKTPQWSLPLFPCTSPPRTLYKPRAGVEFAQKNVQICTKWVQFQGEKVGRPHADRAIRRSLRPWGGQHMMINYHIWTYTRCIWTSRRRITHRKPDSTLVSHHPSHPHEPCSCREGVVGYKPQSSL